MGAVHASAGEVVNKTPLETAQGHVAELALAKTLEPYRARTLRTAQASGRHVFHVREILSLCACVSSAQVTEIYPALDLGSVTCFGCLRALADRIVAA